jgi:hypothetical protein
MLALSLAACGGEKTVDAATCAKRFNGPAGEEPQLWVKGSGRKEGLGPHNPDYVPLVWLGPSKVRPDKCIAEIALGQDDVLASFRETFFKNSHAGFVFVAGDGPDIGPRDLIGTANAYGLRSGKVVVGKRPPQDPTRNYQEASPTIDPCPRGTPLVRVAEVIGNAARTYDVEPLPRSVVNESLTPMLKAADAKYPGQFRDRSDLFRLAEGKLLFPRGDRLGVVLLVYNATGDIGDLNAVMLRRTRESHVAVKPLVIADRQAVVYRTQGVTIGVGQLNTCAMVTLISKRQSLVRRVAARLSFSGG